MGTRIAIVDDKQINRTTVREKVARNGEIEVVLEAENGRDFLEKLAALSEAARPEVVLMDLEMPVMDGIQTISIAAPAHPSIRFVVLTVFEDSDKIFQAIQAGAHGYLLKEESAFRIIDAISQVLEFDGMPMSPAIARKAIDMLRRTNALPENTSVDQARPDLLSERELDILKELSTGKSYQAIGEKLFISKLTVRKHVSNIYNKLHVTSRTQVVTVAQKNRWI